MSQARTAQKHAIRQKMMALEEAELATAVSHYESFLKDARLDEGETHDVAEIADAREAADLAAAFDHPIHTHHAKIDAIENAKFELKDAVEPGAVVSFNGRNFVVLVSTARFECEGKTYMGISTSSPIYKAMAGLSEGEHFTHNGRDFRLDAVF